MERGKLSQPKVISQEEWLVARKEFFLKEKAITHELDTLRAERRRLPWVKVEKHYVFEGPDGKCTLADLFRDRGQLAVYHFMLTPGSDHVCKGCSFVADHIDAARKHFGDADLSFAAISRAPLARIEQVKRVLGWTFPWVSSYGSDFNFDFGASFKKADIAAGRAIFNYGTPIKSSEDMMGASIFARTDSGEIFHTYSTFARGIENLMGTFMWLDLTPKGRHQFDDGRNRLSEDGLRDSRLERSQRSPEDARMIKLFEFAPTRSLRVRWVLQELDVPFEAITINLVRGEHTRGDFLKINPAGKLPALVDGDVVLTESVAIVLYLGEKYADKGLMPANLGERAQLYRWLLFAATELEQPLWRIARNTNLYPPEKRVPRDVDNARADFKSMAAVLDRHMKDGAFVTGDRVSVADFVVAHTLDWANEIGLLAEAPRLQVYLDKMLARPKAPPRISEALASIARL